MNSSGASDFSAPVTRGEWSGCEAHVYPDQSGAGWHIEILGFTKAHGSVAWDVWADDDQALGEWLTDLGVDRPHAAQDSPSGTEDVGRER